MPSPRRQPRYFDYVAVANAAQIADSDLSAIEARTQVDYPTDQMMFELRMLRTCESIRTGAATVADALAPDQPRGTQLPGQAAA